ncbi:PREDICTED: aminoacylase-1-like [Nicrophorus vespilloides]|uniref:N-acyl-aliphatic-L-amino acid amidohydrolase n=1 Tax=Nicrophorus vespilloides TaxID=110193 RepID=A0ABM1MV68_NICVS|nr:PREDICTED: aminoacylase-1-like [Nicrophorus vespilloides]XP_017778469.1 PREDICTED: aminoacylase-1-like [Nicrophorus vespilloides]XP_017778470.1 PREDICTED: aminoacylase-1-like [Nicrophorus vespilloides]
MVLGPFKGGREGKTAAMVARTPSTFEIRTDLFTVENRKMSDGVQTQQTADFDALAVKNFREYLRIPSVHPNINYDDCIKFLEGQAIGMGLPYKVYHTAATKPVFIMTWEGTEPNAPSVMLNSHMDVVPVFEENWTHKPFGAEMDADGKIYARGAQDMKCVGIQYLETIRRLKTTGIRLKRTIHCIFVPDEEMGGIEGMRRFVKTDFFKSLNVGFALDEGMTSETDEFLLYYGERTVWTVVFRCPGQTGHGSLLLDNTAAEKMRHLLDRIYDFREKEKQKLENNPEMTIGDVTTVNVTIMQGGVQSNVLPAEFVVTMDCRIPVTVDHEKWFETLQRWCKEAGKDVAMENRPLAPLVQPTKLDESNKYWMTFKSTIDKLGLKMTPRIFPGGTDSRYLRQLGIPALGFSPINNTPVLLHDDDEYLNADVFLKGIEIYCKLVSAISNVDSD